MTGRLQLILFLGFLLSFSPAKAWVVRDTLPDERAIDQVLETALSYLGTPYRYGGLTNSGIDCSGLVYRSFESVSFSAPRSSAAQATMGQRLLAGELKPGDLVFFRRGRRTGVRHVGLVVSIDENTCMFVHSSCSEGVTISDLNNPYWKRLFVTARRWWIPAAILAEEVPEVVDNQVQVYISPLPLLSSTVLYRSIPGKVSAPRSPYFPYSI